jgi:hypothetical protein
MQMWIWSPHAVPCVLNAALCDAVVVLLQPLFEAVKLLLCAAAHCHLGNAGWDCLAELAACDCTASQAAWVQLLQDTVQSWCWQL